MTHSTPESELSTLLDLLFEPSDAMRGIAHMLLRTESEGESNGDSKGESEGYRNRDFQGKRRDDEESNKGGGREGRRDNKEGNKEGVIGMVRAELVRWAEDGRGDKGEGMKLLETVLAAHPRLGEKRVESERSRAEQAQLQGGGDTEGEVLARWNRLYEERFPGLRYVVFVNGRSRAIIVENMQARIERGDIQLERIEAIDAVCDIAADRARKLGTEDLNRWKNANRVSQLSESTPG